MQIQIKGWLRRAPAVLFDSPKGMTARKFFIAFTTFLAFTADRVQAQSSPVVATADGRVQGSVDHGVESWRGIPFAAPPIGSLRWRAPQSAIPWTGIRDALEFGSDCMQIPSQGTARIQTKPSEDCLYVNVWRPEGAHDKLPVLVWIYGGGWVEGGTSPSIYSGAKLAAQDVIVVSLNYRVGRFGFFGHPALTRQDADGGLFFNYGTLDQIAGLRWVKRNIAAFGGDPDNITVMGESAGAVSLHVLATSPLVEDGLFHKAIIMSGANGGDLGSATLADGEGLGLNFARRKGLSPGDPDALAKLRALPAEEIVDGLTFGAPAHDPATFNFGGPIEEGRIVTKVGQAYASGRYRHIPMMIGATADDMGGRTGFMVAGARRVERVLAEQGVPVFPYRFSYVPSASATRLAVHASDIPFFFGTHRAVYGERTTASDDAMAAAITDRVIQFARTSPNAPSIDGWSRSKAGDPTIVNFSARGAAELVVDPWSGEIEAAPPPNYPGLSAGGGLPGAPSTGDPSAAARPTSR